MAPPEMPASRCSYLIVRTVANMPRYSLYCVNYEFDFFLVGFCVRSMFCPVHFEMVRIHALFTDFRIASHNMPHCLYDYS